MQRVRISQVIFESPQSPPGSGVNGQAGVLFVDSDKLRLERADNGIYATAIKDGRLSDEEDFFPMERVRKTIGKRAEALDTEPEAPKAKRAVKGAEAS